MGTEIIPILCFLPSLNPYPHGRIMPINGIDFSMTMTGFRKQQKVEWSFQKYIFYIGIGESPIIMDFSDQYFYQPRDVHLRWPSYPR